MGSYNIGITVTSHINVKLFVGVFDYCVATSKTCSKNKAARVAIFVATVFVLFMFLLVSFARGRLRGHDECELILTTGVTVLEGSIRLYVSVCEQTTPVTEQMLLELVVWCCRYCSGVGELSNDDILWKLKMISNNSCVRFTLLFVCLFVFFQFCMCVCLFVLMLNRSYFVCKFSFFLFFVQQGYKKRALLSEILPVVGADLRLQRLFAEYQQQLSATN